MTRTVRVALLLLAALAAAGAWWWWQGRAASPDAWPGYAEADYVDVSPTLTGRLTLLAVARGQTVAPGALLFEQDPVDDRAARAAAAHQLAAAAATLANLQRPSREAEVAEAVANLAQQRAARARIAGDLARNVQLVGHGFVTRQLVDQERADLAAAEAQVTAAEARLALARAPIGREAAIAAQRQTVAAARASLDQAEWRLAQRTVTAPVAAVVAETDARAGETVNAGATVVRLLPPANIRVRFFVSEPELAHIRYGEKVAISCDGCGTDLTGRVSFIAPQAEYTPPVIYSAESRSKLVFLIEATPPPAQALQLKPGEPVAVRPAPSLAPPLAPRPAP